MSGESNESSWRINCLSWAKSYGGTNDDYAFSVEKTADGGIVIGGETSSFGAGGQDLWILKLNNNYDIQWQKAYGGGNTEMWNDIVVKPTSDGVFIGICRTFSFGVAYDDIWVIKINSDETLAWQKAYGGSGSEEGWSIVEITSGKYIVAGFTNSFGAGNYDFWILKLDPDGSINFNPLSGASTTNTNATVTNTNCAVTNTNATVANTNATVTNTTGTVTNTNAIVNQQAT